MKRAAAPSVWGPIPFRPAFFRNENGLLFGAGSARALQMNGNETEAIRHIRLRNEISYERIEKRPLAIAEKS